ncbi:hypothetical protein GCM10027162_28270 [Streptomyces incanus]
MGCQLREQRLDIERAWRCGPQHAHDLKAAVDRRDSAPPEGNHLHTSAVGIREQFDSYAGIGASQTGAQLLSVLANRASGGLNGAWGRWPESEIRWQ